MRGCIDEITVCDEGGGKTNGGSIEGGYQDLGVGVESIGDLKVVGDEGAEPVPAEISAVGHLAGNGDVGTSL